MEDEALKAVFNFDGAELYNIFQLKTDFINYIREWDLENSYWTLRFLRMEFDSKLNRGKKHKKIIDEEEVINDNKETEKKEIDRLLNELDESKNYYSSKNNPSPKEKADFYVCLENFYMHICLRMKEHGIYFREGQDNTFAVLRR